MAKTLDDYLQLIPTQHRGKPKYEAMYSLIVEKYIEMQEFIESIPAEFDIDEAVGVQLDVIGIWVGLSRFLEEPIAGVYFTWGTVDINEGWGNGIWQGEFDPDTGLEAMPDSIYRIALKSKIVANHWDGSIPGAYEIWESLFLPEQLFMIITDRQDMSMDITLSGFPLSFAEIQIFIQEELIIKPAGVRIKNYFVTDGGPAFTWGIQENNNAVAGWGLGEWAEIFEGI